MSYIFPFSSPSRWTYGRRCPLSCGPKLMATGLPLQLGFVHGKDNQNHYRLLLFTFLGAYGTLRMSSYSKIFRLMPIFHLFSLLYIFRKWALSALRNPLRQSHWWIFPTLSWFYSSMGLHLEGVVVVESPCTLTLKFLNASGGLVDLGTTIGHKC